MTSDNPVQRWQDQLRKSLDDLSDADWTDEMDIVEEWYEEAAELYLNHEEAITENHKSQAFEQLKRRSALTKSGVRDQFEDEVKRRRDEDSDPLNEWLPQNVTEVVVRRSTDHVQDPEWVWRLDSNQDADVVVTQTSQSGQVTHFDQQGFRTEIYKGAGEHPAPPAGSLAGGQQWKNWIIRFIKRHKSETVTEGTRTAVLLNVRENYVKRTAAYTDEQEAVELGGMYLDRDEGVLYVPAEEVLRRAEDSGLTARAVQAEAEERGLLADEVSGASVRSDVGGQSAHWWAFDVDELDTEPREIDPEPPAEAISVDEDDDEGLTQVGTSVAVVQDTVRTDGGAAGDEDE